MYSVGVEREGLRCNTKGFLMNTEHPKIFGDRMKNSFITTDFGEAQMELRTAACNSTAECYEKLREITNVVLYELKKKNEYLWPYSMPCRLPEESAFRFNDYTGYPEEHEYELALYKKYGYKMHNISGIHFNFSMEDDLYRSLCKKYDCRFANKDEAYFYMMRSFVCKAWMLEYFIGASPYNIETDDFAELSLRCSRDRGFGNKVHLAPDLSDKKNYIDSIRKLIDEKVILRAGELYYPVRAKAESKYSTLTGLENHEVNHIELRIPDINPFDKCGISKTDMDFMTLFVISCLTDRQSIAFDYREVAEKGITTEQHDIITDELQQCAKLSREFFPELHESLEIIMEEHRTGRTKASRLKNIGKNDLPAELLSLAKDYAHSADETSWAMEGYPKLETASAVVIKDAISQGVDYTIVDEGKSFVEYSHHGRRACVIQATKTALDSYIFPFITDDKLYAKKIMAENGINTPSYVAIKKMMPPIVIESIIRPLVGRKIAVKPKTTNYGQGITVLTEDVTEEKIRKAMNMAFEYDDDVFIEDYAQGREYRFLVIGGKCLSVVWRRNASVVGDGKQTIRSLIEERKTIPRYRKADKDFPINEGMLDYLSEQGLSLDYVPPNGVRIWLQKVSNAMLGGEPVAVTDIMPERFKAVAEKLAGAFQAKICGIDMVIDDLAKEDYSVLEINDNPGIFLNEEPIEGKKVRVGLHVLKLLGLIEDIPDEGE